MKNRKCAAVLIGMAGALYSSGALAGLDALPSLRCEAKVLSTVCGSGEIRVDIHDGKFVAHLDDAICWGVGAHVQGALRDEDRGGHPFFGRRLALEGLGTLELRVPAHHEPRPGLLKLYSSNLGNHGVLLARSQYDLTCSVLEAYKPPRKKCRSPWLGSDPDCLLY